MKPTGFRHIMGLVLFAALPGCAVGPNYHAPAAPDVRLTAKPLPTATIAAGGEAQAFTPGADIAGDWWTIYQSPALDSLITTALAHNPSLQAAQATLVQAEETLRSDYGVLVPTVTGAAGVQRDQLSTAALASFGSGSSNSGSGGASSATTSSSSLPPYTLYNASLSVSYALDLWGGARREVEGQTAVTQYQRYELEAAYLSLTGNIVTEAVQAASLQAQIDATNQVIAAEQQSLSILQTQFTLGGVSQAQVLQQQTQVAQAQATLPPLQDQLQVAQDQLAAYEGGLPGNTVPPDLTLDALQLPQNVPVSVPSAIVAQRPDIQAAAAQLHTASANVGVADAEMLPQINLTGEIGHESITPRTLFTPSTLLWNLVAGLSQPIFEGGQLAANRKGAIAALRGAGAKYQETVISAFQNVADVLAALQYDAAELRAADAALDAASRSLALTQSQYKLGGQPFTAVLTAQTAYQNAAITDVKARAARLADTAALYNALGGGWWHRQDVTEKCCGIIP